MARRWALNRLWSGAVLLSALVAFVAIADDHDSAGSPSRTEADTASVLNRQIVDFAAKDFSLPVKYLEKTYGGRLPRALAGAMGETTDEAGIAGIVARLYGVVNDDQVKTLVTDALARKKTIEETPEASRSASDKELLAFLSRVLWGAKILHENEPGFEALKALSPPEPKFSAFREAFLPAHGEVAAKNREFHDLVAKARTGTAEEKAAAQAKLREDYDAVPSFLEGQLKSNNDELAKGITEAVALKDGEDHVLDLTASDGTPHRIVLGKDAARFPAALREGLAEYAPFKDGGFGQLDLAKQRHADVRGNVFRPRAAAATTTTVPPVTPPVSPPPASTSTEPPESLTDAVAKGMFKRENLVASKALADRIQSGASPRPRVWLVGNDGLIKGATRIGDLSEAESVTRLEAQAKTLPSRNEEIILYCGC